MMKIKLIAEILGLVGLLTFITLLIVSPSWFWIGFLMMAPNTYFKIKDRNTGETRKEIIVSIRTDNKTDESK